MKQPPIYLNLFQFRFPATAIASILHRLSGVILFLMLPVLLWLLSTSLQNQLSFEELKACLAHPLTKFITWGVLSALFYHLIAGIRHIIMDMGFGDGKCSGRAGAYIVMLLAVAFAAYVGVCIW